jgi:hypothetical protein
MNGPLHEPTGTFDRTGPALAAGAWIGEAARQGAAAGAVNALHPGQGQLEPDDVARLLPAVTLAPLGGAIP